MFFFALTMLFHSASQSPPARAQDIERYGNFKIDVSNPDSMKKLVKSLRNGTKRSDFDKLADSPKWHAPYLMERTSPDGKLTAEITYNGIQIRKAYTDMVLQTLKAEKSERNPFIGAKINDIEAKLNELLSQKASLADLKEDQFQEQFDIFRPSLECDNVAEQ